jgi:alpha-tubulin suppressor-like RCC1 family protein
VQVLRATRVPEVSCKPSPEGALACGESFVLAVAGDGAVMAWGRNHEGQCGIGQSSGAMGCVSSPARVDSREAFDRVWAGANHACGVLTGGELLSWGCGLNGTLGIGPVDDLPLDGDIYLSCHPHLYFSDLAILIPFHQIHSLALF